MTDIPVSERCPDVPQQLKYVELRLPGTFRELVANNKFTNEEIGKIVRCIALDTDIFMTQKIEPEVFYYRQKLLERDLTRQRVDRFRRKRKMNLAAGGLSESRGIESTPKCNVTVTSDENSGVSPTPLEKTPSILKEKKPPIVPLERKAPFPLEKKKRKLKRNVSAADLSEDLFSLATGGYSPESTETGQERPQERSEQSGGTIALQDIERGTGPVLEPQELIPSVDTREDLAWIPERFAMFWKEYPRKVAKGDASKAFTKVIKSQTDVDAFMKTLLSSIRWWKEQDSWKKDGGKFIPYPATWLNRGSWEDSNHNSDSPGQAEFLVTDDESEADLIRRMQGG